MRFDRRGVLAMGIAATLASYVGSAHGQEVQGVTETEILIGSHGPLTGAAAYIGLGARSGAQLAIDEVNAAGGINGRQLRMLFEDDGFSPTKALGAVKKLVDDDKVFMIFGASGSNPTVGTLDYLREVEVPTYISISSAPAVTRPFSRYVFRGATTEAVRFGEIYGEFLGEFLQAKKIAVLAGSDEFAKNEADAILKFLKVNYSLEPAVRLEYKVGDTDFTPQLLKMKEAQPELIMLNGNLTEAVIVLRQARELGMRQPVFGSATMVDTGLITKAGYAAEGMMGGWLLPQFLNSKHPDIVAFRELWTKANPDAPVGRPNIFDFMAYGDMHVVAEGLRRAGKGLDKDKFVGALEGLKEWRVSEIATPRTFTDWHHIGNLRVQMMIVANQHWVPLGWTPSRPSAVLDEFKK